MDIRKAINLFEAEDDIQKRGFDKRDIIQKYQDLIDHPTTDPFMREMAQRKLDKLRAEEIAAKQAQAKQAAHDAGAANIPAMVGMQINYNGKPMTQDQLGEIYLRGNGKTLRFQQVIDRLMPLEPYRIDFQGGLGQWVGDMTGYVWFHPEDEPEVGGVRRALGASPTIWASAMDEASNYYRGGASRYFMNFSKYQTMFKPKRR
jgi:hypothetical protein